MKHIAISIAAVSLICSPIALADKNDIDIEAKKATYLSAMKELGGALKSELKAAIKAGGPIKGVEVCHTEAPKISAKLLEKKGFSMKRVSLKPRNANHAPDKWEEAVLKKFEQRKAGGEKIKTLDFHEIVEKDGQRKLRYMKAIRVSAPCLTCHGSEIEPDIQDKLKKLYPEDKATGYQAGDLRGAISVTEILP